MPRGGYRPGAGRPKGTASKATLQAAADAELSPLDFLLSIMRDTTAETDLRLRAAALALPYVHARAEATNGGKKAEAQGRAKQAATGRFAPAPPPRLVASRD